MSMHESVRKFFDRNATIIGATIVFDFETHGEAFSMLTEARRELGLLAAPREILPLNGHCAVGTDGDCFHRDCPQTRDGEPHKSGRSCPLHQYSDEDY